MAQLKDLIVTGNSKFVGNAILDHDPTLDLEAATKHYIDSAIDGLPAPMQFKGSLGTGGTITALPAAAASNAGFTYKVITEGTYITGETAKVGDMYISNGTAWVLIPSGDDAGGGGTVTSIGFTQGSGIALSVTPENPITSSGTVTITHGDTSSQASVNNSGRTYIQDITLDDYGHVTALSSATETVVDTDSKYALSGALASHKYTSTLTASGSSSGTSTSDITFAAGSNISLSDNTSTRTITISASDTTYTFANGTNGFTVTPSGGTAQTVTVTPSITNNITGTGTSGSLAKFSGANTLTDGPAFNTSATAGNFLTEKGTWERPLGKVFKGQCDTAAATTTKQVTCPEFTANDLVTGAIVFVTFKYTNSGAVASIKLSVNNTTAKNIKYMASAAESNLPGTGYLRANMTYRFVYNGTYWVCDTHYDANSNTIGYQIRNQYAPRYVANNGTANSSLYRYKLCFTNKNNELVPTICVSGQYSSAYRAMNTAPFDPFRGIRYYTTDATIAAGSVTAATGLWQQYTVNATYGFNIADGGLTENQPVFLKAKYDFEVQQAYFVPDSTGTQLAMSSLTQALPATDPGVPTFADASRKGIYIYIYLGTAYNGYQFELFLENPVYAWNPYTGRTEIFTGQPFSPEFLLDCPTNLVPNSGSKTLSFADDILNIITRNQEVKLKFNTNNLYNDSTSTNITYIPLTGIFHDTTNHKYYLDFSYITSIFQIETIEGLSTAVPYRYYITIIASMPDTSPTGTINYKLITEAVPNYTAAAGNSF